MSILEGAFRYFGSRADSLIGVRVVNGVGLGYSRFSIGRGSFSERIEEKFSTVGGAPIFFNVYVDREIGKAHSVRLDPETGIVNINPATGILVGRRRITFSGGIFNLQGFSPIDTSDIQRGLNLSEGEVWVYNSDGRTREADEAFMLATRSQIGVVLKGRTIFSISF